MTEQMERKLTRSFFGRPALEVARDIVGRRLVRRHGRGHRHVAGIVVEAEAYAGLDDPASHSYGGRRSQAQRGHVESRPVSPMFTNREQESPRS